MWPPRGLKLQLPVGRQDEKVEPVAPKLFNRSLADLAEREQIESDLRPEKQTSAHCTAKRPQLGQTLGTGDRFLL
jgi:hypothetical protein